MQKLDTLTELDTTLATQTGDTQAVYTRALGTFVSALSKHNRFDLLDASDLTAEQTQQLPELSRLNFNFEEIGQSLAKIKPIDYNEAFNKIKMANKSLSFTIKNNLLAIRLNKKLLTIIYL